MMVYSCVESFMNRETFMRNMAVPLLWFLKVTYCFVRVYMVSINMASCITAAHFVQCFAGNLNSKKILLLFLVAE